MSDHLDLSIDRPRVIYQQIREHVRNLIKSGKLAPGDKLPPTSELAARWQTHAASIHSALTPLVKEGLLSRKPKIGTFVTSRHSDLTAIGIYYDSNIWTDHASAFKRAVHVHLADLLESKKIEVRLWLDPRGTAERSTPWSELLSAADRREIQAIIATDVPDDVVNWLEQLSIPAAYFTYAPVRNKVGLDFKQFAAASARILKKQGCRSAGVISILEQSTPTSSKAASAKGTFYNHFLTACRAQGLEVRDEWMRMADGFVRDESQEDFGYVGFAEIWRQSKRPDGLVVFPDTSVPGVITSVLEKRVNVPEDLKIVAHKHIEIDFLCPLPISYLYSSTRKIAAAMFSQIQRQLKGESCAPIALPFRLSDRVSADRQKGGGRA